MNPRDYERQIAKHFEADGFEIELTSYQGDYGVDVFARKGAEKIAIQAKMYGETSRRVNRSMVMELHGAAFYFDCTSAIIATNGDVLPDALEVAQKLGIVILQIPAVDRADHESQAAPETRHVDSETFESIWHRVTLLEGSVLHRSDGKSNAIVKVDWSGVTRITSNGKRQHIKIEIFRKTINRLLQRGSITRAEINNEYAERASSGVVLILSHVDGIEMTSNPTGLRIVQWLDAATTK